MPRTKSRRSHERRYDRYGELRMMAEVDGWVMFRRPYRQPYCVRRGEWDSWARKPEDVKR